MLLHLYATDFQNCMLTNDCAVGRKEISPKLCCQHEYSWQIKVHAPFMSLDVTELATIPHTAVLKRYITHWNKLIYGYCTDEAWFALTSCAAIEEADHISGNHRSQSHGSNAVLPGWSHCPKCTDNTSNGANVSKTTQGVSWDHNASILGR